MSSMLDAVRFNDQGLVGAVVQDFTTGEVLMFAWMNRDALERTIAEKRAWYWSRSRGKLWLKGESSGHVQTVRDIRLDCDGDAILIRVDQAGGACHTGFRSCFYRKESDGSWREEGVAVFSPDAVYKK